MVFSVAISNFKQRICPLQGSGTEVLGREALFGWAFPLQLDLVVVVTE